MKRARRDKRNKYAWFRSISAGWSAINNDVKP